MGVLGKVWFLLLRGSFVSLLDRLGIDFGGEGWCVYGVYWGRRTIGRLMGFW